MKSLTRWYPKYPRKIKKQLRKNVEAHVIKGEWTHGYKFRIRWQKGVGWHVRTIATRRKNRRPNFRRDAIT